MNETKTAIVTGSATGVGAEVAIRLAEQGCNVVVNYTKSGDEAKATAEACARHGAEVELVRADVAKDEDCRMMAERAFERWGRIDYLVNNAGVSKFAAHADLESLTDEDFLWIYRVNVIGAYQMIRAAAPAMKEGGAGSVVNVSSVAGVMGIGSSVAYAASKGALNTMTLSLARALGPEIRINAVCPGMIDTRWLRQGLGQELFAKLYDSTAQATPLKAVSTPAEVAEPILFFLTSASHITGETLLVDAGTHLGYAPLVAR